MSAVREVSGWEATLGVAEETNEEATRIETENATMWNRTG